MSRVAAFTLVELLVSLAIFLALMLVSVLALGSFNRSAEESQGSLAIHARAQALERFLRDRLGTIPVFTGLRLVDRAQPGRAPSCTFMYSRRRNARQFSRYDRPDFANTNWHPYALRDTGPSADLLWGHLEWRDDGRLHVAHSRWPIYYRDAAYGENSGWNQGLNWSQLRPTPQRHMSHLFGLDLDASLPAGRSGPLRDAFNPWVTPIGQFADRDKDGSYLDEYHDELGRLGLLGTVLTIGVIGNTGNTVNASFAVRNADGQTRNKDLMNLLGPSPASWLFPDQRQPAIDHLECFELIPLTADGRELLAEGDSLGDGGDSLDWIGFRWGGQGADDPVQRPAAFRCLVLIHDVDESLRDDDDEDDDGDHDESLLSALRQAWPDDGTRSGRSDRRQHIRDRLRVLGHQSRLFSFHIGLPH